MIRVAAPGLRKWKGRTLMTDLTAERVAPEPEARASRPRADAPPEPLERTPALSRPLRYLVRMLVFLALVGFAVYILQEPMRRAFMANPALNGLIIGVLLVGVLVALREIGRLSAEARAGQTLLAGEPPTGLGKLPLLSPLLPVVPLVLRRGLPSLQGASVLEAVAVRLDDGRDTLRYLAGLLVFLGLLGTFWGLLETVSSVGSVINTLRTGADAGVLFEELKAGLSAPLAGMGLSFSSSLFGIAGSLILGFLDLQIGQAQRRFRNEIEEWLASGSVAAAPVQPPVQAHGTAPMSAPLSLPLAAAPPALSPDTVVKLEQAVRMLAETSGGGKQATQAMANLAEGIQGLVQHMRSEQQLIRDWVEAQSQREKDTRRLLERLLAERTRAE
jgi:hypothetical protein